MSNFTKAKSVVFTILKNKFPANRRFIWAERLIATQWKRRHFNQHTEPFNLVYNPEIWKVFCKLTAKSKCVLRVIWIHIVYKWWLKINVWIQTKEYRMILTLFFDSQILSIFQKMRKRHLRPHLKPNHISHFTELFIKFQLRVWCNPFRNQRTSNLIKTCNVWTESARLSGWCVYQSKLFPNTLKLRKTTRKIDIDAE